MWYHATRSMRSRIDFSSVLLLVGMVAMISISLLPVKSGQALLANDVIGHSLADKIVRQTNKALADDAKLTGQSMTDKFGVRDVLPSANGGPQWFLNEDHPKDDRNFSFRSSKHLDLHSDGSKVWQMDAETGTHKHGVRIHVDSPDGKWKNVEM